MEQHPFDINTRLSAAKLSELEVELWQPPEIGDLRQSKTKRKAFRRT
jgi:hypothetical protein